MQDQVMCSEIASFPTSLSDEAGNMCDAKFKSSLKNKRKIEKSSRLAENDVLYIEFLIYIYTPKYRSDQMIFTQGSYFYIISYFTFNVCVKINEVKSEVKCTTKPRTVLTITRPSCMDISDFNHLFVLSSFLFIFIFKIFILKKFKIPLEHV